MATPSHGLELDTFTARERADANRAERHESDLRTRPWKLALAVLFAAWIVMHAWLWHQRGLRPRLEGLDAQLTMARWLTASAFLWVLLYPLLAYALSKLAARRSRRKREHEHEAHRSEPALLEPRTHPLAVHALWILPTLAALIGGSVVFGLAGTLLVPAIAGVGALLVLLPWLPVVALLRRAFPGGRGELVLVGLLAFVLVGFTQSFCNRGFYEWKIRNRSVEFQLPAGATFQDRTTGEALPQGAPAAPKR